MRGLSQYLSFVDVLYSNYNNEANLSLILHFSFLAMLIHVSTNRFLVRRKMLERQ